MVIDAPSSSMRSLRKVVLPTGEELVDERQVQHYTVEYYKALLNKESFRPVPPCWIFPKVLGDDLIIFAPITRDSGRAIRNILSDFAGLSGLELNSGKSSTFCGGRNDLHQLFSLELGIPRASLPIGSRRGTCQRTISGKRSPLPLALGYGLGSLHPDYGYDRKSNGGIPLGTPSGPRLQNLNVVARE
ncbi:hypothetical protein QJS10_CPB15g01201 [Acorus calamus]|uniref:Reverse transcriptase domain-containing protein n=1 Tax=Acorus calamus TaxID=4465 RepID=A0AAV9D582_ACOCL|nr:hypothetical protein QJS10_CPB15g01201 [Acorus calamus]